MSDIQYTVQRFTLKPTAGNQINKSKNEDFKIKLLLTLIFFIPQYNSVFTIYFFV